MHAACVELAEEALRFGDDDALGAGDDDDAAAVGLERLLDRMQRARRPQQLLAERAGGDELAVAEEDAHELVHPRAGGLRQVDEAEEMPGRRGVDDDLLPLSGFKRPRAGGGWW